MPASPADLNRLLWSAADALRGSFNASQYKHIILSVVFLKSLSEAFTERRAAVAAELHALGIEGEQFDEFLEDPDEYTSVGVAWLPPAARWSEITAGRPAAETGTRLNEALAAIAVAVPALADALPRPFPLGSAEQRALAEVVRLVGGARFNTAAAWSSRDDYALPDFYSDLLAGFAEAEGRQGGEFFTPAGSANGSWSSWNRSVERSTTRPAARAACCSKLHPSPGPMARIRRTSPFSVRRSTSRPRCWPG